MSHFVLRRIGRFKETAHAPRELAETLKAAPVVVLSDQRLQQLKQACAESGDTQRLQTLEAYEQRLAHARFKK